MTQALRVHNPKISSEQRKPGWSHFYAGFSEKFAREILSSSRLRQGQRVLDPWNGSGTTTVCAGDLGINALGYDLNPAMVLVAKGRSLKRSHRKCIRPLLSKLCNRKKNSPPIGSNDPLLTWLMPSSAANLRLIEERLRNAFVEPNRAVADQIPIDDIPELGAFFYAALFRTLRRILDRFISSNPTWVKRPHSKSQRLRPKWDDVREIFRSEVTLATEALRHAAKNRRSRSQLRVASSEDLPLPDKSVDFVLGSPPYCTRIDYAVATSPELAILRLGFDSEFDQLRRQLTGTPTISAVMPATSKTWGQTCLRFLEALKSHDSKASSTYYYKNHLQYFSSIATSLSEINRVLKPEAKCVLVVQDSFYKDLHNDLPTMVTEMAQVRRLDLAERRDFPVSRTFAGINPRVNQYRKSFTATESVLVLHKSKGSAAKKSNNGRHVVKPISKHVLRPS